MVIRFGAEHDAEVVVVLAEERLDRPNSLHVEVGVETAVVVQDEVPRPARRAEDNQQEQKPEKLEVKDGPSSGGRAAADEQGRG